MKLAIRPMTRAEQKYSYTQSQQIAGQTGCIGHLRADMDTNGKGFFSSWDDHRGDLKTQEFKDEFDAVINALRFDEQYGGVLKNRTSLTAYCHKYPDSAFEGNYTTEYGFRADTEQYAYLLRLNPNKGDYNLYCYCYRRDWLDDHMKRAEKGIRFITPNYKEKFRIPDGDKIRITTKSGEIRERIARYIDDYHMELSGGYSNSLYHICEFAEQLEEHKCQGVIPLRSSLPETCYHANIHKALKYAVKIDLIATNPADKIERPKKDRFVGSFYDSSEVQKLFEVAKGTHLEIPIFLGAFYGLRRSEALGLKWDAIDFQNDTITIRHTVTSCNIDGKHVQIAQDTTKTKSSMRTLPLVPVFKEKLLEAREKQDECRRICGRCYDRRYLDYVCVDEMGGLVSPHYLTSAFPKLLEKNNLRRIRYHDLRHSCASLLLANGVPMKQIQEWLGHSDFATTANVYAHLDYNSKLSSADAMLNGLSGALSTLA